ncbi:MAG: TetR/AcrR family transcriptional regulator, partial [Waddliaceae bacterium]
KVGYRAFSYRDIAKHVGIKTSSIHYHFPTKADLATALAKRWRDQVRSVITEVDSSNKSPRERIESIMKTYREKYTCSCEMCPCSMLSSDLANLPEAAREEVQGVWEDIEGWFAKVLKEGRDEGVFHFDEDPETKAMTMFAAIEGASISACTFQAPDRMFKMIDWLLKDLKVGE